jgi:hypothetical protein
MRTDSREEVSSQREARLKNSGALSAWAGSIRGASKHPLQHFRYQYMSTNSNLNGI